ncbi:MAG: hypothetical protein JOZ48_15315, partial [Acidobacteriaceae bacterium]|nr:hypothetical protein [Acidobacteriaceae bacterium]
MSIGALALAAAHNLTPRTIATWYPSLLRTPRVMVPIQLDVLMVRQEGEVFADCQMTAPDPNAGTQNRRDLLPKPFAELPAAARPVGAYLHWALPDALTHGTSDGATGQFYPIPDRWLVLRLSPSTSSNTRRAVAGWVIRAGDKTPTVQELDQWVETGPSPDVVKDSLTALGHGDPAWAAYYENVVNRLAFYDPLAGIQSGPLAYVVCGWYANPADDPLGDPNILSLTDFDAIMNTLLWHIDDGEFQEAVSTAANRVQAANLVGLRTLEYAGVAVAATSASQTTADTVNSAQPRAAAATTAVFNKGISGIAIFTQPAPLDTSGQPVSGTYVTNGSWWPAGSFYHGSVVGIGWPGVGWPGVQDGILGQPPDRAGTTAGEFGGPPPASGINVAVGNTITEALAALVARANNSPQEATMLEAYLLGALSEVDKADGQANIDALLHSAAFATRDGGFVTEQIQQPPMPDLPPATPAPVIPNPGVFANQQQSTGPATISRFNAPQALSSEIGHAQSIHKTLTERLPESTVITGGLWEVIGSVFPTPPPPTVQPAKTISVQRALPRFFQPADPVFLLQGAARSFKHGGDGRYTQDGKLICRLTGFCVTETSSAPVAGFNGRPAVTGDDVLERGVENGSVPQECEDILCEVVLVDPGTALVAAQAAGATGSAVGTVASNFMVEQTAWWATRDPRFDAGPLVAHSGIRGTLPSPIAVTPPARPWTPIHLDWEIEYVPSAGGVGDWSLDEIDYIGQQPPPAAGAKDGGITLSGRAHLTAGAAETAAQGVKTAIQQAASTAGTGPLQVRGPERFYSLLSQAMLTSLDSLSGTLASSSSSSNGQVSPADTAVLNDIVSALDDMDVLSGAMDNFHTRLRGGLPGDGLTVPQPPGSPAPVPFIPVRAGFLRILRLRLVDGFGQFVDLAGSSDQQQANPNQIITTGPAEVPNTPGVAALPPRFTSPARLWLRYLQAGDDTKDANATTSPVCGYVLPNHLDGSLEFFDDTGANLGEIMPDAQAGIVWEEAPGQPSTVGQNPARAIPNPKLAGIARALIEWGLSDAQVAGAHEDALSALLRIIDSTLWSVDPFGHVGDEHLSLLVGHPVAVMRARVRLEVDEPVTPGVINTQRFSLRLGALTHWQDGLLGYFVNDDYTTLYCADAAVAGFARQIGPNAGFLQQINLVPDFYQQFSNDLGAGVTKGNSPVTHPYVNDSGVVLIAPNQDYLLTLLVEPQCLVYATTGLLPRKDIGMRREWVAGALAQISPTFRFGPLLVDPKRVRMPVANEIKGTWSWDHLANVSTWVEDPIINSTSDAIIPPDPVEGT